MQDPKIRECEKTPEEACALADHDLPRDPKEFLREIYKEAYNAKQDPDARISKVLGKCSALFSRLSADQEKIAKKLVYLTWALVALTTVLLFFTIVLYKDTHQLTQHENLIGNNGVQKP